MKNEVNRIVHPEVSIKKGEFKNDSSMTSKLPSELKTRILNYLREPPAGLIGDVSLIDPVTGKCYNHTSIIREKDGFTWNSAVIYMFENYDIKLSEEFLRMFQ